MLPSLQNRKKIKEINSPGPQRGGQKIARAKNSGGPAGGYIRQAQCKGAGPEQASGARQANTLKFDIFCKRPANFYQN